MWHVMYCFPSHIWSRHFFIDTRWQCYLSFLKMFYLCPSFLNLFFYRRKNCTNTIWGVCKHWVWLCCSCMDYHISLLNSPLPFDYRYYFRQYLSLIFLLILSFSSVDTISLPQRRTICRLTTLAIYVCIWFDSSTRYPIRLLNIFITSLLTSLPLHHIAVLLRFPLQLLPAISSLRLRPLLLIPMMCTPSLLLLLLFSLKKLRICRELY